MKKYFSLLVARGLRLFYFLLLLFAFSGCEKVIEVELNDAHPTIVIEGNLSRSPVFTEVKISKTGNYFGETSIEKISNAVVTIENDLGGKFNLEEVEKGIYQSRDIFPQVNRVYKLAVELEGQKYEAESKLNQQVSMDSLSYYYDDGFAFLNSGYIVKVYLTDPAEKENFYRLKIYENDTLLNEIEDFIIFDDQVIDGNQWEINLRGNVFQPNDTVSIELISLDKGAYIYFNTFQELINTNPGSAAPANPTSNISNGALGYFSAWTSDTKTIIIRE